MNYQCLSHNAVRTNGLVDIQQKLQTQEEDSGYFESTAFWNGRYQSTKASLKGVITPCSTPMQAGRKLLHNFKCICTLQDAQPSTKLRCLVTGSTYVREQERKKDR